MSNFNKVKTFMETFGQEVKNKASFSSEKINNLRYDLIKEELEELKEALNNNSNIVHEAADTIYHLLVTLEAADVKFEDVLNELEIRKRQSGIEEKNNR